MLSLNDAKACVSYTEIEQNEGKPLFSVLKSYVDFMFVCCTEKFPANLIYLKDLV